MIPKLMESDLEVYPSGDGLVLTNRLTGTVTKLDKNTSLVWKTCDGKRSPWKIQREIERTERVFLSEDEVWCSLTRLRELNLLIDGADDAIHRYQYYNAPAMTGFHKDWRRLLR